MNRITTTFPKEVIVALEKRQKAKGLGSVAQCIRELVDLGLKFEMGEVLPAPTENPSQEPSGKISAELSEILALKKLLTHNSKWLLESRLHARYLVEISPQQLREANTEILKKFKGRAGEFIRDLLKQG